MSFYQNINIYVWHGIYLYASFHTHSPVDKKKKKKGISPMRKRRHSQSFSAIRNQLTPLLKITEKKFLEVRDPSRYAPVGQGVDHLGFRPLSFSNGEG